MKVLVVVDMQNDFIDGALRNEQAMKIVDNVAKKIEEYRKNGDKIIFTQDTHYDDYMNTQEGKNLPVPHCIVNTKGWEIAEAVKPIGHETIFPKPTFGSIALGEYLELLDFDELEFVGLCTDICVLNNVAIAKAKVPEIPITVDAACCAGVTPMSHDTALNAMKMIQVNVINQGEEPWRI